MIRQSSEGLYIYDEGGRREVPCGEAGGRAGELLELHAAIAEDRPTLLDARWGMATVEVCLAILHSSAERREIAMQHQSPAPAI